MFGEDVTAEQAHIHEHLDQFHVLIVQAGLLPERLPGAVVVDLTGTNAGQRVVLFRDAVLRGLKLFLARAYVGV
jgi:hypothetical protein